jgi:RNA polymerase sigma-70 factor (ECF subfamily)
LIRTRAQKGYACRKLDLTVMTHPTPAADELGALMAAAQRGDSAAYAALLRAIAPRIRGVVRRQRGFVGHADAEDLVQDVLLAVHSVRATYDPSRPFVPWLLAIVRNRLADGARRYARTTRREIPIDDEGVTLDDLAPNTQEVEVGDASALREAVAALPAGQREAIELLKLKELSLKEAAEVSGTSVGALKVATHRAMLALKRALAKRDA